MSEYLIYGALCILVPTSITLVMYFVFRRGLATRIFVMVGPAMGVMVFFGFVSGKLGVTVNNLLVVVPILATIGTATLLLVNQRISTRISAQVEKLLRSSSQLAAMASQSSATSAEQSTVVSQVTATTRQLSEMSTVTATSAEELINVGDEAVERSQQGLQAAGEAVRVLASISEIDQLAELVHELADQSNLLALNASIEAAKAGEHGRGFSVVANEVRNLAKQSSQAAVQIRRTIQLTEQGSTAVKRVNHTIEVLGEVLERASDQGRQISGASSEQSAGIQQITEAMTNAARAGTDNADAISQLEEEVAGIQSIAHNLETFIMGDEKAQTASSQAA